MTKKFLLSAVAAGTLAIAGVTAATMSAPVATVAETITVTSVPASGSTVKELPSQFTFVFNGATKVGEGSMEDYTVTWSGEDITALLIPVGANGNEYSVRLNTRGATPLDGSAELVMQFPEGFFTLDGSTPSPAFKYELTIDTEMEVVTGQTMMEFVVESFPKMNSFVDVEDGGDMAFVMYQLSKPVTVNTACTETINLTKNGAVQPIATIAANAGAKDPMAEVNGNMVSLYFTKGDNSITEDGTYTVSVPKGFFKDSEGNELDACEANYIIGVGTFDPASGSTINLATTGGVVNSKNQWYILNLTPMTGVSYNDDCTVPATITDSEGNIVATIPASTVYAQKGVLKIKFYDADNKAVVIDKNGKYTLSIPEGFFIAEFVEGQIIEAPSMTLEYTIEGGKSSFEQKTTLSPAAGAYQLFPTVTVTYEGAEAIQIAEGATVSMDMSSKQNALTFDVTAEGNKLILTPKNDFNDYVSPYTVYRINIPAGLFKLVYPGNNVLDNDALTIDQYKINPLPIATISPAPGSTVKELTTLTIETKIAISKKPDALTKIRVYNVVDGERGTEVAQFGSFVITDDTTDKCTITATINKELGEGEYEVAIPSGFYQAKISGQAMNSPVMALRYTISVNTSVESLIEENANVTVYTLTGVRVLDNAEPAALNTLAKGLYIVNGKKVVIR